ncbi:hypothetical protein M5362_15295 [Streptomyces sp. Je 1-79]|uniref:hypothetical protein n=1 Tax=Streptomyces sp. Je 1-79 TaxID=2943847 RepID=UPI0021A4CBEA|nr:hypothetical protein [Streptomyces sp. Je 1-79]MCT4354497.1 hypothetical protein [Streptomyces sp. Je 1-79]
MGSLRNPVGPLPSSIYWRRRAIALCLIALTALIAVWVVTSGGGGGKKADDSSNGASPAPSITPGPSGSGPAISEQPGGRDESGDSGENSGGDGGDGGDGGSGTDAGGDAGSGDGGENGGTDGGDGGAGASAGQQVPADSPLPNCAPGAVQLTLRSAQVSYAPGEKPRFQLVARNTSANDCKADLGPRNAVLTISDDQDDEVWSSKDCPRPAGAVLFRVPARSSITHTVEWDRAQSAPQCATAPAGPVGPGTYLVEAAMPGVKVLPASFTLAKD